MIAHFLPTEAIVHKKEPRKEDGLKTQTVKVEITFVSSGDTSKMTKDYIANYILKNLIIYDNHSKSIR